MITRKQCPVEKYARDVVDGRIVAGRLVRLACERHLRDLEHGHERGLSWSQTDAENVIEFFSLLRLPADGQIDGKPFDLEPFQQFIVGSIFGWKGEDGYRRFRTAYIEAGKGCGKSPLAGGIGLYGMIADGEAAAEIYSAATSQKQASILWRDAKMMVEASPALRKALTIHVGNIAFDRMGSFFRPVSSEKRGLDGIRPHICLADEVHEHRDGTVLNKLRAGTKGRLQALLFAITNSGYDRTTICWDYHQLSAQILEGDVENDSWFAYVCGLDPCEKHLRDGQTQPVDGCEHCDDWQDEKVWPKANPGLDTILPSKYLREQVAEAQSMPSKQNIVKRLNFCIWTDAAVHAIPMDRWDACATEIDLEAFKGREVFAALDIGATSDFTAMTMLFPHDDCEEIELPPDPKRPGVPQKILRRSYTLVPRFWIPERPVKRDSRTEELFAVWGREGYLRRTAGDVVDYEQVLADIVNELRPFNLTKFAVDRGFQGAQISQNLQSLLGEEMIVSFPQGLVSMNAPFRELLELIKNGRLHHDGNPVMRWMASNTASEEGGGGLIKPSKKMSSEKIDGITAATMAIGVALTAPAPFVSIYSQAGNLML